MSNPLYADTSSNNEVVSSPEPKDEVPSFFHLVAATAIYDQGGVIKQRTVNIMLQTETPNIVRSDLDAVNQGVLGRVNAENNVQANELKDIVILNICRLAAMPAGDFYGTEHETTTGAVQ